MKFRYPELSLRVWAEPDGVHLHATLQQLDEEGVLRTERVAAAVWQPQGVTSERVVDWGRRALESWLVGRMDPSGP